MLFQLPTYYPLMMLWIWLDNERMTLNLTAAGKQPVQFPGFFNVRRTIDPNDAICFRFVKKLIWLIHRKHWWRSEESCESFHRFPNQYFVNGCKKWWFAMNNDVWSLKGWFVDDFHSWLHCSWKSWVIGIDTTIEVIVVSLTTWEVHLLRPRAVVSFPGR